MLFNILSVLSIIFSTISLVKVFYKRREKDKMISLLDEIERYKG